MKKVKQFNDFITEGKTPDYSSRSKRLSPDPEILEHIENYNEHMGRWDRNYEGFLVQTNKRNIKLLILAEQDCCEDWGYFLSEDDFQTFYGSEIKSIEVVDEALRSTELRIHAIEQQHNDGERDTSTMFVNFNTSSGLLQFVAYNNHNGYYGHRAIFMIDDKIEKEETL